MPIDVMMVKCPKCGTQNPARSDDARVICKNIECLNNFDPKTAEKV